MFMKTIRPRISPANITLDQNSSLTTRLPFVVHSYVLVMGDRNARLMEPERDAMDSHRRLRYEDASRLLAGFFLVLRETLQDPFGINFKLVDHSGSSVCLVGFLFLPEKSFARGHTMK